MTLANRVGVIFQIAMTITSRISCYSQTSTQVFSSNSRFVLLVAEHGEVCLTPTPTLTLRHSFDEEQ